MRPREVLQKTCSGPVGGGGPVLKILGGPARAPPALACRTTCLFYQAWTHTRVPCIDAAHPYTRVALYGRPPLHCVNTILSLQPDLDYLESTCNAHIRSATEDVFDVTMAGTCSSGLRQDTTKKITVLKKQSSGKYT